jgi:hypothetical protein
VGAGELAAEEFDEAAGARAAVGTQQAHAIEEDEELEDFGVFGVALGILGGGLLGFVKESGESVVESALYGWDRWLLIYDAGGKRFVGFGLRLQSGEDVGVSGGGLRGAEFGDGEGDGGEKLRMDAHEIGSEAHVEQWGVGGELARVLLFVTMGGEEVGAVGWAVEGNLTLGAAADGADGFAFCGTEPAGFAFLTDWTGQEKPPKKIVKQNYGL